MNRLATCALLLLLVSSSGCGASGDSSGDDDDTAGADASTGDLPFLSECTLGMDEACASGLCFDFNAKGPHCTHGCDVDDDCEAPSPGCSGMGVCKAPDIDGGGGGGGGGG